MKIKLAIEWFLNPDHLPFIVALQEKIFAKHGIEFELIEPDEHYDGLSELLSGNIEFATNEPLHLIEQFDEKFLTLGTYFATKGGVLMKQSSFEKLKNGEQITVTTPVSNDVTNTIGFEIIRRFYAKEGVLVRPEQVTFVPNGFEHLKYMQEGADAGWLYFYNFEGIEAQHLEMDVIYMDAQSAGFANFSALDIFTNKEFYTQNSATCKGFVAAIKEAIVLLQSDHERAMKHYYEYTKTTSTPLMDDIIEATIACFDADFRSEFDAQLPILEFFREINITNLSSQEFKSAFLS